MQNAVYVKPKVGFKSGNSTYDIWFVWAERQQKDRRSLGKTLGYEVDFTYLYERSENLVYGADLGFIKPGDYYESIDNKNNDLSFGFMGRLKVGVMF